MLVVIIVSWNVCALLDACIASLLACAPVGIDLRVVVVDNGSNDGSVALVHEKFADVEVITNETNIGFSAANNVGLRRAESLISPTIAAHSFVLLLNPDTIVHPGAIDTLLMHIRRDETIGIVGPQLRYPDGTIQPSRRRFPNLATMMFESTWLQPLAPKGLISGYFFEDKEPNQTCDVDWLVGAALMARFSAYIQCGGLDATLFFMYSEETDWCFRLKHAGWRIVYVPSAVITHHEGASSSQVSANRMTFFNVSKVRYARKHLGPAQALLLRINLVSQHVVQLLGEAGKLILGHKRALRQARIAAYRQVITALATA